MPYLRPVHPPYRGGLVHRRDLLVSPSTASRSSRQDGDPGTAFLRGRRWPGRRDWTAWSGREAERRPSRRRILFMLRSSPERRNRIPGSQPRCFWRHRSAAILEDPDDFPATARSALSPDATNITRWAWNMHDGLKMKGACAGTRRLTLSPTPQTIAVPSPAFAGRPHRTPEASCSPSPSANAPKRADPRPRWSGNCAASGRAAM